MIGTPVPMGLGSASAEFKHQETSEHSISANTATAFVSGGRRLTNDGRERPRTHLGELPP